MKIVPIFAENLFAIQYEGEEMNEYQRLMNLWRDMEYLHNFLTKNESDLPGNCTKMQVANRIMDDQLQMYKTIIEILRGGDRKLEEFFRPLHNNEYQAQILSLQKGRESYLRMYAIKVDNDTFVITGGAIKLTRTMQEREHTNDELLKLDKVKRYLDSNGVFDFDSFYEFYNE